jgi:hypothetical protein
MSSTPTLPRTPRLSAAQPPERVPTQNLDASEPAKAKVQEQWENGLFECCTPSSGRCKSCITHVYNSLSSSFAC